MAEKTGISWCDATFNPWIGCSKVSEGCKYCYADRENERYHWNPDGWGPQAARKRTGEANWKKPLQWNRQAKRDGVRRRVFCSSLADIFDKHPSVHPVWRGDLWTLILATPHLEWLLLTKRIELAAELLPPLWLEDPPDNVRLGVTAEDKPNADRRILELLRVWRGKNFVSAEPLLGPLWFSPSQMYNNHGEETIDWIIAGGESGPDARPTHPAWARVLRDQCTSAGVPFHWKQWGEWLPVDEPIPGVPHCRIDPAGEFYTERAAFSSLIRDRGWQLMARVGKRSAGRLLDGQIWDQFPQT